MSTQKRSRPRREADFAREIIAHVEIETARLIEEGMAPEDARRAAHRRFGSLTIAQERFYESRRWRWLDHLRQDVRDAIRTLRRAPVATVVAIGSLAAGIGAMTMTLTVRDVVFHRPPPTYRDPAQLSRVQVGTADNPIRPAGNPVPAPLFVTWQETLGSAIGGAIGRGQRDVRTADRTETLPVRAATPALFQVLGVEAAMGVAGGEASGDAPVILSHPVWQRLFDGRADVVGQPVWIDNQPHAVAGVLPARFWFPEMESAIWTIVDPRQLAPDTALDVVVRRGSGVTAAALEAQLRTGLEAFGRQQSADQRAWLVQVSGVEGTTLGRHMSIVLPYLLGTAALLTFLLACANVAILMIARWTTREHEIAIRASIGASRSRIVRALLTESVVVAVGGAALGLCATLALRGWLLHNGGEATYFDLSIDPWLFVQTGLIALGAGTGVGVLPALYETRRLHINPLRAMAGADVVRQRWRHALVVFEIVVTVALLIETTAMIDGYRRATTAPLGYATRPLLTARLENPGGVPTSRILEVVRRVPGVAAAAVSTSVPFGSFGPQARVSADAIGTQTVGAERASIGEGFFSTLGVELRAGRTFTAQDGPGSGAVIVNEALARRVFQDRPAVGNRLWIGGQPYAVVGVVANYMNRPMATAEPETKVFFPLALDAPDLARVSVLVRAHGDGAAIVRAIRTEMANAEPGTAVTGASTVDQTIAVMGLEILVGTAPLFPIIAIGLLLTTAGIYGVLAFAIARRGRELAIRVAVGATGRDLVRLVSGQTVRLVIMGSVIGIALTFGLARALRAAGGAGSVFDPSPVAFVVPLGIVILIGVAATWIPSRRARRIDPVVLLRSS